MTVIEMVKLLGGEFNSMEDSEIEQWIEFCEPFVSKKVFGKFYERALALMICHKMKMAGHGENSLGELGKIGNTFAASSVSDGGSSISFASSGAGNLQTDAEYGLTIYGAQYLQLRKMVIMGIRVSGEGDFRGRL